MVLSRSVSSPKPISFRKFHPSNMFSDTMVTFTGVRPADWTTFHQRNLMKHKIFRRLSFLLTFVICHVSHLFSTIFSKPVLFVFFCVSAYSQKNIHQLPWQPPHVFFFFGTSFFLLPNWFEFLDKGFLVAGSYFTTKKIIVKRKWTDLAVFIPVPLGLPWVQAPAHRSRPSDGLEKCQSKPHEFIRVLSIRINIAIRTWNSWFISNDPFETFQFLSSAFSLPFFGRIYNVSFHSVFLLWYIIVYP